MPEGKFNNQQVLDYCTSKGIEHRQVSAKTGDSVDMVFKSLAEKLTKVHPKTVKKDTPQNEVVAKVMAKKNEFKLKTGAVQKNP